MISQTPPRILRDFRSALTSTDEYHAEEYFWDNRNRGAHAIVQYTEEGQCWFEAEDGTRTAVREGEAFVCEVPSATRYWSDPSVRYRLTYISILGDLGRALAREARLQGGPVIPLRELPAAYGLFREIARGIQNPPAVNPIEQSIRLFAFFAHIIRGRFAVNASADPVTLAFDHVQSRFREPFTIKELAAELGISPEHLSREFQRRYGEPPARMLRELRLREANLILGSGSSSLPAIAAAVGFADVRSLKRLLGRAGGAG